MRKFNLSVMYLILFGFAAFFAACGNKNSESQPAANNLAPVDSLGAAWNTAWNNQDSTAITAMLAEDAMLMAGDWIVTGKDSLNNKWVRTSSPVISNLSTEILQKGATTDFAYVSGTYSHDYQKQDKTLGQEHGIFTIIWKKNADQHWKITMMQLDIF